jgi:PAS domain S-box-containing protein
MAQQQQTHTMSTAATSQPASACVAMVESQPLFRAIFDHAPLAQMIGLADGTILRINPAFTSLLGYAPAEVCGRSVMTFTHPDDVPKSWASSRRVGLNLPRLTFQKRYLHKSGRAVTALVTLSAVELEGSRHILVQIVDLTALKQANREAQRAHDRLHTALESAGAGTWEVDLDTGHMEWDDAMRRQFRIEDHEPAPNLEMFLEAVDEDDRRSVRAAIHNATMPGHGRFDHEFRFRLAQGEPRWYRSVGRVQRDAAGRAVRGTGITFDITQAKQAQIDRERMQAALHRAERRLAAVVTSSRDAIVSASTDLRVTTWNPAAESLFGYAAAEAIGMSAVDLFAEERRPRAGMRVAALQAGAVLKAHETVCVRKDGTRVEIDISMAAIVGDDGKAVGYSAILRDITERKVAELRLQETQRRLEE